MKFFLILAIFFLTIPSILAVGIDINEEYKQGETLLATISGNFVSSLTKDNIFFYKDHVRIPLEYNLLKIDGEYYVYGLLIEKDFGNYSLSIENVQYKDGNKILNDKISKNFSINNLEADFSINPGFISTQEDFSIKVQNLLDTKINIKVTTKLDEEKREILIYSSGTSNEANFPLSSGEEKDIQFKINSGEATLKTIKFESNSTSYEIPIYLLASLEKNTITSFRLEPSILKYNFPTASYVTKTIYIYNNGEEPITNILLTIPDSLKDFVTISKKEISKLEPNSNIPIELTFFSDIESQVEGNLKAEFGEITAYSSISLTFTNDYIPLEEEIVQFTMTCSELGGEICDEEETKCVGETKYTEDGVCCNGKCSKIVASSNGKVIAIIILVIIVIIIIWFYLKKFKRAKKPVDLIGISKVKEA